MEIIAQFTYPALLILHIIGVAMGVGGAITTDVTFLRSIWNRSMTSGQLQLIEAISKVVITGLGLLIVSGVAMVLLHPHYLSLSDGSQLFWVKMTLVAILSINGLVFHKKILPILQRHADKPLNSDEVRSKLWLLAITGGLSGISWFSVLALGVLMQAIDWPYLLIMNLYLLAVVGAVTAGYIGIFWILFSRTRQQQATADPDQVKKRSLFKRSLWFVIGLLIIGLFALLHFVDAEHSHEDSNHSSSQSHIARAGGGETC